MRIACSTICSTGTGLDMALEKVASLGFKHVDLMLFANWAHLAPAELVGAVEQTARSVSSLLDRHGLAAVAMNVNPAHMINSPHAELRRQNLEELRAVAEFARHLAVPVFALQPGQKDAAGTQDASLAGTVEAFREITAELAAKDLTITFEPHSGSVAETYESMQALLDAVPALGVAYDPSHFVAMGLPLTDSEFLLPRTAHVHLRDAVKGNFQAPMGEGILDFAWVVERLKAHGYQGALAIEYIDTAQDASRIQTDILQLSSRLSALLDPADLSRC